MAKRDSSRKSAKTRKKKKRTTKSLQELDYVQLVDLVRRSRNKKKINDAFSEIVKRMNQRISGISNKFRIPGASFQDVYQESLVALRYKAVKDYDPTRGNGDGPYPFEKFALLCIRRHLSTRLKASYQNKQKVLNESASLSQERSCGGETNDSLYMIDIIPGSIEPILDSLENREYYKTLFSNLFTKLSKFEKEVFILYTQKYSYEQIAVRINRQRKKRGEKIAVNVKAIDNALSRIKSKAQVIFEKYG